MHKCLANLHTQLTSALPAHLGSVPTVGVHAQHRHPHMRCGRVRARAECLAVTRASERHHLDYIRLTSTAVARNNTDSLIFRSRQ
jgi:hypothetical protein